VYDETQGDATLSEWLAAAAEVGTALEAVTEEGNVAGWGASTQEVQDDNWAAAQLAAQAAADEESRYFVLSAEQQAAEELATLALIDEVLVQAEQAAAAAAQRQPAGMVVLAGEIPVMVDAEGRVIDYPVMQAMQEMVRVDWVDWV
jgi:hypothetical protein